MVRDYELMYIARPELDEEGLQAATESVDQLISSAGGTVVRTTNWGRRRLAYEVDHLRDGNYMLLHIRLDGSRVAEVERALAIHETVFRHLLVVREGADDSEAAAGEAATVAEAGDAAPATRQAAVVAGAHDALSSDDEHDDDAEVPPAVDDEEDN